MAADGQKNEQEVGETAADENGLPALAVKVTDVNRHRHLEGLVCSHFSSFCCVEADWILYVSLQKRQKGIGSVAHDPAQSDIRKFFGGGVIDGKKIELEEGRAKSNALDETVIPQL